MIGRHFFGSLAVMVATTNIAALCGFASEAAALPLVPIGVAKVDITPETPVRMYGYSSRTTESEGVAGPLKAKALAIGGDEEDGPAVLLTVDCGAVPADVRQEVFRRVTAEVAIRPERFVLCNAHNHSGPNLKGMASISGKEHEHLAHYATQLTDRLVRVVLESLRSRQPGRLAWTEGSVDFATNRRVLEDGKWVGFGAVLDAPASHRLPLLRVTDRHGTVLAVVIDYACHCTTLRGDFKQIHGDWAGCAQQQIEADHPGVVAMITIGCGADSDPYPHSTVALCERHGQEIAAEVNRLLRGTFRPVSPNLTAQTARLKIACLKPPSLDQLRQRSEKSYAVQSLIKRLEQGEALPREKSYQVTTWAFGDDLAMVFLSNEVVVDYAMRLQREMDGSRLWITAYANDVSSYIVSKRLIAEGGYEVNNSLSSIVSFGQPERVRPAIEDRIIGQVESLLPPGFHRPRSTRGAARSPAANQAKQSLFRGKGLANWRQPTGQWYVVRAVRLDPTDDHRLVVEPGEGVLVNGPQGRTVNLLSTLEHGDVEAHIEFCLPRGSNSGIYFQGRYEIQVYDSFGVAKDKYPGIQCGGIYPRWTARRHEFEGHAPRVNASKPPGQWQSFDVVFRAPRFDESGTKVANAKFVKVTHNGQVIHENVELSGPTRAAAFPKQEKPRGPLMLQGDHGPIAYRNIWLKPIRLP